MSLGLVDRVRASLARTLPALDLASTNAYRVLDDEPGGITVDRYDRHLVLSMLGDLDPTRPDDVNRVVQQGTRVAASLGTLLAAETDSVYLKVRPRQANTVVSAQRAGLTPEKPVWGRDSGLGSLEIRENGIRYHVRLGDGLPTGIYLDQRGNRAWLRDHCSGLRVLNTFAYTCAFSVAAAVGGATRTVSMDAAAPALAVARENFLLNGVADTVAHDLIRGDVLRWLPKLANRGDVFDVVILDPPSYACVDGVRISVQRDYGRLVELALGVLAPRGRLLACVNHTGLDEAWLLSTVQEAVSAHGGRVLAREIRAPGVDFSSARMKSVLVQVG